MLDIFFRAEYGKLYEKIEKGTCEVFEYSDALGTVRNMYIKRPVPWLIDGVQYYDVITPYGYGGPVVLDAADKEKLIDNYWGFWLEYCAQQMIISEFVRFNPLLCNYTDFQKLYHVEYNRHTLAVDTMDMDFEVTQFHSKCRNMIRKAEKLGVSIELDEACDSIEVFCDLYHKTMIKDHAKEYYFFPLDYFNTMREVFAKQLLIINAKLDGMTIAASLFMLSDDFMHYHLSATDPDYYGYAANNLILRSAAEYAYHTGRKWLHLGGGISTCEEDRLFKFKRSFGKKSLNLKEFWIGQAIYNATIYERLAAERRKSGEPINGFFPIYRG